MAESITVAEVASGALPGSATTRLAVVGATAAAIVAMPTTVLEAAPRRRVRKGGARILMHRLDFRPRAQRVAAVPEAPAASTAQLW